MFEARISPLGQDVFLVQERGFQPNETLFSNFTSSKERIQQELIADADGAWHTMFAPGVIGKKGGVADIGIQRKQTGDTRSIRCSWVDAAKP